MIIRKFEIIKNVNGDLYSLSVNITGEDIRFVVGHNTDENQMYLSKEDVNELIETLSFFNKKIS